MGIEINLWRAKIGCFNPKARVEQVKKIKRNHYLTPEGTSKVWYTFLKLVKFQLFFSMLLLLCGDIETNPGPVAFVKNLPIQGTYHQGDEKFCLVSRGKQCVACCLVFLIRICVTSFENDKWTSTDLDQILLQGDFVYRHVRQSMIGTRDFLEPKDLPPFVKLGNSFYRCSVKKTYTGNTNPSFIGPYPLVKLELAFTMGLSGELNTCIFICKGSAVAVTKVNDNFLIFDSHARNVNGRIDAIIGKSVLYSKGTLNELCVHIRHIFDTFEKDDQFDLHVIKINEVTKHYIRYKYKAADIHVCKIPISIANDISEHASNKVDGRVDFTSTELHINTKEMHSSSIRHTDLAFENIQRKKVTKNRKRNVSCNEVSSPPKKKRKKQSANIISVFHKLVSRGPEYVCVSCSQTFFYHSVQLLHREKFDSQILKQCVKFFKSVNDEEWICTQCRRNIVIGKVPQCSIGNGFCFPKIPSELQGLTKLEERLISPRIPFMQVKELPRGGQLAVLGNVVNVPANVNETVKLLPRNMDSCETIPLKLKRSLSYKSYLAFEQVRPETILTAARWLVRNSKLFKNEGICFNSDWNRTNRESIIAEKEIETSIHESNEENVGIDDNSSIDWSEDDGSVLKPSGNADTVMQPADFREFNRILNVAPAEGNTPLSMFQDYNAEFLSFPTIYCGETRQDNNTRVSPVHYSTICKWELRNIDRRVASNITNIFFKLKKLQIKQISETVSLALRKCKVKNKKITVNEVLSEGAIDSILKHDEGYKVLRRLRGSPPYWERTKKDIFAMIRQLGIPTWFCSFSSAETKWSNLLRILGKLVKNETYTDNDIANMSWTKKNDLIKADPVTCTRYFDYRFQTFLNKVLMSDVAPIGKIRDYFIRVEFQQRGSPHVHILFWIEGAPSIASSNNEEIVDFIDQYVTCKKNSEITDLVNYHTHRHARTCRKKGQPVCRFGFPLPPLHKTMILHGLDGEVDDVKTAKANFEKVTSELERLKSGENCNTTLAQFLKLLNLSDEEYILALRSSIKLGQRKVFLKRQLSEIRVNNYNDILIKCWEANMDIQYILDPYACAAYIVSYISKGQRGMSTLLSNACKEAKNSESDIRQQVRKIGNTFLTHVEIGAQEACYIVLQMPLKRSSRQVVYVDTNNEAERVVLIKPKSVLQDLPKSSTSIESDSALKRYQRRPYSMNHYCYADFIALFSTHFPQNERKQTNNLSKDNCSERGELPETNYELDCEDDLINSEENDLVEEHVFKDGTIMKKRTKSRVIYSIGYNKENDSENYFREQLMLYTSWRNFSDILGGYITHEAKYMDNIEEIGVRRQNYVCDLTENISQLEAEVLTCETDEPVVSELQHQNENDAQEGSNVSLEYGCFNPGPSRANDYDLAVDLNFRRTEMHVNVEEQTSGEMNDFEYRSLIRSLNMKQNEFFYHVMHHMKTKTDPIYYFLSGGAGVGKSVLLKALNQGLFKYWNRRPGENMDETKILICAPTGKAAFNVGGNTIHSAFNIPADQGYNFKPMDMQRLSSYQSKLKSLKIVFIDEISMVGRRMFDYINLRLQEIMGSLKPFGGVSVIAFGDLYQLKPVMDQWIFLQRCNQDSITSLASNLWIDLFSFFELDQIMRQKDDLLFAQILNRLREGNQTENDLKALQNQVIVTETEICKTMPHLFTRRQDVETHNNNIFSQTDFSKKTVVEAIDTISGDLSESIKKKIISKIPDDATKTKSLMKLLPLGENLPAEICVNIDVSDGLTNGTPCTIMKLDFRVLNSRRCSIVWVDFNSINIGKKCRTQFKHLFTRGILTSWTPILEITRQFNVSYYKSFCVTRRQFPLTLAAAKTVHKAQGSTLENAVIGLGSKRIEHLYYVALSRVKKLSSVFLYSFEGNNIKVTDAVVEEMNRLRTNANISLSIPRLYMFPENVTKILFQNCRSLKKHFEDIKQEVNLMSADIIAFAESCLSSRDSSDDLNLSGFHMSRNDDTCCHERPYHGTTVYSKVYPYTFQKGNIFSIELTHGHVYHNNTMINICFIYCSPKISSFSLFKKFFSHLNTIFDLSKPQIVLGDFNIDNLKVKALKDYLKSKYCLNQLIECASTDYGSVLDHIYTNIPCHVIHSFGVLESYFSDHKPIFIALK